MKRATTQVAIIGCGPAGLLLSQLLHNSGIDCIVLERRSRDYVEARIRAGILEWSSVEALRGAGVGERMDAEGLPHDGFNLCFDGDIHRIDLKGLTGQGVMAYGQTELTRDMIAIRLARGGRLVFEAEDVVLHDVTARRPSVSYTRDGQEFAVQCDFIAGCDGFHGVSRPTVPADVRREYEKVYPLGWLGMLSDVPPVNDELVYTSHARGFALCSMRSPTRSRYYIQCDADEDVDRWDDDAIWDEIAARIAPELAGNLVRGPSIEKSVAPLRSFVCEPLRHGNLLLAGDAAHIVPPTGAKGLNLAIADVVVLHRALEAACTRNDRGPLESYSGEVLQRVWKVERFSWYMSMLLHRFPDHSEFDRRMQRAEFDYVRSSQAASRAIAENYVGLPIE